MVSIDISIKMNGKLIIDHMKRNMKYKRDLSPKKEINTSPKHKESRDKNANRLFKENNNENKDKKDAFSNLHKKRTKKMKENERKTENIRSILKSEMTTLSNIKALNKEKAINDTIVAVISFISIVLAFFQVRQNIKINSFMKQ